MGGQGGQGKGQDAQGTLQGAAAPHHASSSRGMRYPASTSPRAALPAPTGPAPAFWALSHPQVPCSLGRGCHGTCAGHQDGPACLSSPRPHTLSSASMASPAQWLGALAPGSVPPTQASPRGRGWATWCCWAQGPLSLSGGCGPRQGCSRGAPLCTGARTCEQRGKGQSPRAGGSGEQTRGAAACIRKATAPRVQLGGLSCPGHRHIPPGPHVLPSDPPPRLGSQGPPPGAGTLQHQSLRLQPRRGTGMVVTAAETCEIPGHGCYDPFTPSARPRDPSPAGRGRREPGRPA